MNLFSKKYKVTLYGYGVMFNIYKLYETEIKLTRRNRKDGFNEVELAAYEYKRGGGDLRKIKRHSTKEIK